MAGARDLRPSGPVTIIDRAFWLAREDFAGTVLPAWLAGALVVSVAMAIYYVERIEGIHSLRLPMGALLALAFFGRAYLLSRAARAVVARLWDAPLPDQAGRPVDVFRTSMIALLGLWCWLWLLVLASYASFVGIALVLPFFVLRGAVAPSWIARAGCGVEAGWRGFFRAASDGKDHRASGVLTEAMILLATAALALNAYAALALVMLLARAFGGLEIASIEAFLSPTNLFVVLAVIGVAFTLIEPLRATLSALAYVDARVRAEGLDLRAALEDAIDHAGRRGAPAARAAIVLAIVAFGASIARAQPPPALPPPPMEQPAIALEGPPSAGDRETSERLDEILARPEFREFEEQHGQGLNDLIERLLEWIFRPRDDLGRMGSPGLAAFALPSGAVFLALALLLLVALGVYLVLSHRRGQPVKIAGTKEMPSDPRERDPGSFLDEAARLAESGELREALRALYLATLVALDRRRLIAFDPHLTNWQYLRQMPQGAARDSFAQFTRVFDHKWYGQEPTTRPDYQRCLSLAEEIAQGREP
jgi:hypothetical protein